jgi:hypothetical protein
VGVGEVPVGLLGLGDQRGALGRPPPGVGDVAAGEQQQEQRREDEQDDGEGAHAFRW